MELAKWLCKKALKSITVMSESTKQDLQSIRSSLEICSWSHGIKDTEAIYAKALLDEENNKKEKEKKKNKTMKKIQAIDVHNLALKQQDKTDNVKKVLSSLVLHLSAKSSSQIFPLAVS